MASIGRPRSLAHSLTRQVVDSLDAPTRGWIVVVTGSAARLALGFVASVLIARALGPADFGIFAVLGAVASVVGVIADPGFTDTAVKRIAAVWPDVLAAGSRARAFFWLRLGVVVITVLGGAVVTIALPDSALGSARLKPLLLLALLGVAATATSGAIGALLQATSRFGALSLIGLTNPALTAVLAIALLLTGHLDLISALAVLGVGTALVTFVVGRRFVPGEWTLRPPNADALWSEGRLLLDFGRWLWIANVCAMLASQLDVLLVDRWLSPATVGAYALALNLAMKIDVVNSSLYTVLLPTVSSLSGQHAVRRYVRTGLARSACIALALLPLVLLVSPFVTFFYGSAYAPAIGIFRQLLGVVVFDVFATPLVLLVYHYDRPRLLAGSDALRAGTIAVLGVALIPVLGPTGAVVARLASRLVGALVTLVALASPIRARRIDPS